MVLKYIFILFILNNIFCFSMYEKIISHLEIDEIGTNFPQVDLI